ncbi:M20/M25/M40 family metallo-hydrolase [Poriferisphaera sp. WC338]|uniref:M20/M25/M40 family metallo-hydrolase n=1 Tax=Poriferisphaera sp. WC338 TaxID=3425129 RepID=UPI003D8142B8
MPDLFQQIETDHDAAVERLINFLSIPSVSTDPHYADDVQICADYLRDILKNDFKLNTDTHPTGGHPVVVATTPSNLVANPSAPHVLFYGHYDVQPPDPEDKWETPPFKPTIRDGKVYARGSSDDKGQVFCFIEALRNLRAAHPEHKYPCPITLLIEGEEEIGSANLPRFIKDNKDLLKADICIVCDTSMWNETTPAITYALRGLLYFDIQLHGPSRDLHSGVYGGTLANPCNILTRVLGNLFDDKNRINIPGFYDDVDEITAAEHSAWDALNFDENEFLGKVGAKPFGEHRFTTLERRWARPACDINGIYGGYMGKGAKTVIPTFAGAKVSFRIPASMDPVKTAKLFTDWLKNQNVADLEWKFESHGVAYPTSSPLDSEYMQATQSAIQSVTGKKPAMVREGATIPIVADFHQALGLDSLLIGFGLETDAIHSPNEHFGLDRHLLGIKTLAQTLLNISQLKK